ncbi:Protein CBG26826 [Caenorhabditis briggsae]|uniref:Protein CBG26826 n=1 Tax=Caenorhabditis briggsae TaxID=6238 RepID=B6IJU5_CAEBR|nr:Protein CBG26826 [Caenorhabditis briggsae]CAS00175.1 Protein CBG26826 [Caenorhabditis briggsae]
MESTSDKKPEIKKPETKKMSKKEQMAKLQKATDFLSNNLNQMTIDHFKKEAGKSAMRARIAQYDLDSSCSDGEDYMFDDDDDADTLNLFEEEWEDVIEDAKKQAEKRKNKN